MKESEILIIKEYIKIPKVFYSSVTEKAFDNCIACNKELLKPGVQYVIEKAIRHFDGNITQASKALGIGRNTLYDKIKKYGIG